MLRASLLVAAALALAAPATAHAADDLFTVAGGGGADPRDGLPAAQAELDGGEALAALPGGDYLLSTDSQVWRVDAQGTMHAVAGSGRLGYTGDGGPATLAEISVEDLAVLPGGGFLILDEDDQRVRMVDPSGIITTVAGGGTSAADGIPATRAALDFPTTIAALPGGGFAIGDNFDFVREVGLDGRIRTVAGAGEDDSIHGQPASAVELDVSDIAAEADGSLLVAEHFSGRVDRIAPDGTIRVAARGRAHDAIAPSAVAALPDGGFAFFDDRDGGRRIRRVSAGGASRVIAGGGPFAATAPAGLAQLVEGGPAGSFDLPEADGLAGLPDGGLLYSYDRVDVKHFDGLVAYVAPARPGRFAAGLRRDGGRVFGPRRPADLRITLTQPAKVTLTVAGHTLTRALPAGPARVRLPRLAPEPHAVTLAATDGAGRAARQRARVFPVGWLPSETAELVAGAVVAHGDVEECRRIGPARVDCRLLVEPERCRNLTVSYVHGRIRWAAAPCDDASAPQARSRPLRRRDWICDQRACPPPALFGRVGEAAIIPSD
jgi:hypothetical protein